METSFLDFNWFYTKLLQWGITDKWAMVIKEISVMILIIFMALVADFVTKRIIIAGIKGYVKRSKNKFDDILLKRKVFNRLAHIAPALVIYYLVPMSVPEWPVVINVIESVSLIYIIFVSLLVIDSFLNALHEIYLHLPVSKDRPIKGYVQILKIFVYFIGFLLILSIITPATPKGLLTGLGAFTAVLLLIFKDTILGLVASVQLSTSNMVRPGDWIEMPKRGADGTVLEISLYTVKVQNWDKTIITIPTYSLVSESFTNWRGMEESGGRRIKRSINIDMKSVKFCDDKMISKFKKIQRLKNYIDDKLNELEEFNRINQIDDSVKVNGRRMTNIGVFRKYIEEYLRHHPMIKQDMTFLIRQLQPNEKGLPIEIYVFSKEQRWAQYEALQADIFDHILAVIPEFELAIYQNPTGEDFSRFGLPPSIQSE